MVLKELSVEPHAAGRLLRIGRPDTRGNSIWIFHPTDGSPTRYASSRHEALGPYISPGQEIPPPPPQISNEDITARGLPRLQPRESREIITKLNRNIGTITEYFDRQTRRLTFKYEAPEHRGVRMGDFTSSRDIALIELRRLAGLNDAEDAGTE